MRPLRLFAPMPMARGLQVGERLGWNAFTGMGLVLIGLVVIDGRLLNRFKKKNVWSYEI